MADYKLREPNKEPGLADRTAPKDEQQQRLKLGRGALAILLIIAAIMFCVYFGIFGLGIYTAATK